MQVYRYLRTFFLIHFVLLISESIQAKTINVPADAASVQEAVEMAVSGDEILLTAEKVDWTQVIRNGNGLKFSDGTGVTIQNKDLVIRGSNRLRSTRVICEPYVVNASGNDTMLLMENSNVIFSNIEIQYPLMSRTIGSSATAAPWQIDSGTLTIDQCKIISWIICQGNLVVQDSEVSGYSYYSCCLYDHYNLLDPSIQIGPATDIQVTIKNSIISSQNTFAVYRNLVFDSLESSDVIIENCTVEGGTFSVNQGSYPSRLVGSDAIEFLNSHNNTLTVLNSQIIGGAGFKSSLLSRGIYQQGGNGGSGMKMELSDLQLCLQGESGIKGGKGTDGIVTTDINEPPGHYITLEARNGGNGIRMLQSRLFIKKDSISIEENVNGGNGGIGNSFVEGMTVDDGYPGEAFNLDEFSAIMQASGISQWELYE
jgi:hypothetical protein